MFAIFSIVNFYKQVGVKDDINIAWQKEMKKLYIMKSIEYWWEQPWKPALRFSLEMITI